MTPITKKTYVGNWELADDDSQQFVKKNSETKYSLIEMGLINPDIDEYEVYRDTIDIKDYLTSMKKELNGILIGFGYSGVEEVREHYGNEANQVMAECVFEHYGSLQAECVFVGHKNDCIAYIKQFVS